MVDKIRYRIVFNRAGKLNARGEGLIDIECQQGDKKKCFSTHTYVKPEQFSKGMVVNHPNADEINYFLYTRKCELEGIELDFIKNHKKVTLAMLKEAVKCHATPSARLEDFGWQMVLDSDRKEHTKANYRTLLNNIERFRPNTLVADVDYAFVVSYVKWMGDRGISHNTVVSRLQLLRTIMNEAKSREMVQKSPFERYRIPSMESKKEYLTEGQLEALAGLELEGRAEQARDLFLVGCYTGLRFSDVKTLRDTNMEDGWIIKQMIKTGFSVSVPIGGILFGGAMQGIVDKYGGDIGNLTRNCPSNSSVNQALKDLFLRIGAGQKATFHTSRHTFATLLQERGVDMSVIQKLLGHTKMTTTQGYTNGDERKVIAKALKMSSKMVG